DTAAMIEEIVLEVSAGLELPPADVRAAVERVDALAAGARVGRDCHHHLLVARLGEAPVAEKLLASPRLTERGTLRHGRRFAIEGARVEPEGPGGSITPTRLWMSLVLDGPRFQVAAWFPKPRLWVLGSADLVDGLDAALGDEAP